MLSFLGHGSTFNGEHLGNPVATGLSYIIDSYLREVDCAILSSLKRWLYTMLVSPKICLSRATTNTSNETKYDISELRRVSGAKGVKHRNFSNSCSASIELKT